jgi:tetratricopeptide (TPR) repeat protein
MKTKVYNTLLVIAFSGICLTGFTDSSAQVSNQSVLQNITNSANNYRNSIANEQEKFRYEPYIPTQIDPSLTDPEYVKNRIHRVLRDYVINRGDNPSYKNEETSYSIKTIHDEVVTDDFIRFTSGKKNDSRDTVTIYFKDVLNSRIEYFTPFRNGESCYTKIGSHKFCCCLREFPDLLYYMQLHYAKKFCIEELERFKPTAANYQALTVKPAITEEQRKFILQANALNDNKDYQGAIRYYDKAFSLNPVSYPSGYYNVALIASLAGNYDYAILNMKKYLLLLPDAKDFREAQDKIYGWEALIVKN